MPLPSVVVRAKPHVLPGVACRGMPAVSSLLLTPSHRAVMAENEATIIVLATFREGYEPYFAEYSARVRAYLDQRGARVVRRQRVEATLYGADTASLVMVIDVSSR